MQLTAKRCLFVCLILLALPCYGTGVILVLGDSLSAGHGLAQKQGWVDLLAEKIKTNNFDYLVANASISGLTTAEGLQMLPELLTKNKPNIFILALGSNDGLRGMSLMLMQQNLSKMINMAQSATAKVLLIGFMLPPNLGQVYTKQFNEVFHTLSDRNNVALVPFLLNGFATNKTYFQADGLHPTAEAQHIMLNNVWPYLEPMLQASSVQ